ncbi:MAG: hypothetical protein KJ880_06325 [Candidatus Omnitrophica bacterium]|nr:hypothetical protein [Candidatus Omnitrophota bacterium]MBU1868909.1 hypothetical protein [Candidatus Omnitrophota bacterium]
MTLLILSVLILGFAIGLMFILKPALAVEMQRRFYLLINWKMEPVSMSKELRNTRIMGWFIIFVLAASFIFLRF